MSELTPKFSGFSSVDQTTDPDDYVRRLDERSAKPFWQETKSRVIALLDITKGNYILDIGCGTGDDARMMASMIGADGLVLGIDNSRTMLKEAILRMNHSLLPVHFHVSDAHYLSFANESFDCCRAERVLQHIINPRQALHEMVRVTKRGGRIICVEPDYGATIITGSHSVITHKLLKHYCERYHSGRIGLLLPLLFRQAGLRSILIELRQRIRSNLRPEDESFLIARYIRPAVNDNLISAGEGEEWLEELRTADSNGIFSHILNIVVVRGFK